MGRPKCSEWVCGFPGCTHPVFLPPFEAQKKSKHMNKCPYKPGNASVASTVASPIVTNNITNVTNGNVTFSDNSIIGAQTPAPAPEATPASATIPTDAVAGLFHKHVVYAVIEREFLKTGEPIVKYGCTGVGMDNRMIGYPKGSLLLLTRPVCPSSLKRAEAAVLAGAREKFINRLDIGREYFEGDIFEMEKHFFFVASEFHVLR